MKNKTYFITVSIVFVAITSLHFLRIVFDWPARIGSWDVPIWLSWLAVTLAGTLAYYGFRLEKKED
ncbi:MAG: hypothetical protein HYX21_03215 [Candidatus Yanofskybacteria bacterium]|nr:hypothetical protein [Candidatus Yanofskybacteria bacterium]